MHNLRFLPVTFMASAFLFAAAATPVLSFEIADGVGAKAPKKAAVSESSDYAGGFSLELPGRPDVRTHYHEYSRAMRSPEEYKANRGLRPVEMALLMQNEYGAGSVMGRTAGMLAGVFTVAERGAQVPVDGVNYAANSVFDQMRKIPGLKHLPKVRLRSEIRHDEVQVGFKTRW